MLPLIAFKSAKRGTFGHWLWRAYVRISYLSWEIVLLMTAAHFMTSWIALSAFETGEIVSFNTFAYFYITVATTIGLGDYSPATTLGRYVAVLWIYPGGIALFTTVIAKFGQGFADSWRQKMTGNGDFSDLEGHVLIMGWRDGYSQRMISEMQGDESEDREVVVVATIEENPLHGQVKFIKPLTLTSRPDLERAGIKGASAIIVAGKDDSETLTAGLAASKMAPDTHTVAYFNSPDMADTLEEHAPSVESVTSVSIQSVVRAMQDPGSSRVITELLTSLQGNTTWRIDIPDHVEDVDYDALHTLLRKQHQATLLGFCRPGAQPQLNPADSPRLSADTDLFIISEKRPDPSLIAWRDVAIDNRPAAARL